MSLNTPEYDGQSPFAGHVIPVARDGRPHDFGASNGGIREAGTATHNGEFKAIQVLEDTVFGTVTGNIEGLTGATIAAGTIIHGLFTSVTLVSGAVIIYRC